MTSEWPPWSRRQVGRLSSSKAQMQAELMYGALSHNHLHQILKNFVGSARADIPAVCDGQGKLSLAKLRSVQPAFADAVENGLTWEVLDGAMEIEEPEALDVIQAALNAKNGSFLLAHEMQCISKLSRVTTALAGAGNQVSWRMARDQMQSTMPQFTQDEHFLELYRFTIDLGANRTFFIADLCAFHDKFVDPQLRKMRTSTFALFNEIPEAFSYTKVAAVKVVYIHDKVTDGFCEAPFKTKCLKSMLEDRELRGVMQEGENLLAFFHSSCAPTLAALVKAERVRFLGNLDSSLCRAVLGLHGKRTGQVSAEIRHGDLRSLADKWYAKLQSLVKGSAAAALPVQIWESAAVDSSSADTAQPAVAAKFQLASKLLTFDEGGRATSSQDTLAGPEPEEFNWRKFFASANVAEAAQQDRIRALVLAAISRMQRSIDASGAAAPVDIFRGEGREQSTKVRVVASKDIPPRTLRLLPLVKSATALTFRAGAVWELPVYVSEGEDPAIRVYVQGKAALPKSPLASADVERVPGSRRSDHEWRASDFPWPFWLVQRSGTEAECNCVNEPCTTRHVSTYQVSAVAEEFPCLVDTVEVTVPVMTNTKEIRAGQELVVFWKGEVKVKATSRARTWQDQAKAEIKKELKRES